MARFFISRGSAAMYRRAAVIPGRPPTAEEEGLRQSDSRRVRAPHGRAGRSGPPALASGPIDRRLTPPLMCLKSLRKERRPETPVHSWRLRPLRRTYSCKRPHNRDQGDPAPRRCVVDASLQRLRKKRGRTGKGDGAGCPDVSGRSGRDGLRRQARCRSALLRSNPGPQWLRRRRTNR